MSAQPSPSREPEPIRSVLITGASRGIGRAVALNLAGSSFALLLSSSSVKGCERTLLEAYSGGSRRAAMPWAFFDRHRQSELVDFANDLPAPLALVHCGGVLGPTGNLETQETADWEDAIELNLLAPVRLVHDLLPAMRKARGGKIILFAGGGAAYPFPGFSSYATAKAGLVRFTETIGRELEGSGVSIVIVSPSASIAELRTGTSPTRIGRSACNTSRWPTLFS